VNTQVQATTQAKGVMRARGWQSGIRSAIGGCSSMRLYHTGLCLHTPGRAGAQIKLARDLLL
jgi:hypothetical protein